MTSDRFGILDALFSIKTFAAAMLAFYIALRIGLPRPYWAVLTAYLVSQPLAGAVLSKALFRVLGTVLGAAVAVALIPNLANAPELLSLALAIWLGLCVYLALLDRTPRSYVFLLAGYTASIIGFPSVSAPAAIFDTAILRVQEITLGILCASFFHGVILPRTVTARLIARVDAILGDAARWSADALADSSETTLDRDRRRLALDIFELHQLSIHLPFDTARLLPRIAFVRALQDQISMILMLGAACLDRIGQLRAAGAMPADVDTLLADARAWLSEGAPADGSTDRLVTRARTLGTMLTGSSWTAALADNLVTRLGQLLEAHAACTVLRGRLSEPHARTAREMLDTIVRRAGRRPLHRDHGHAFRSALGVSSALLVLCFLWIASAWPDGASAALITGAVGAILASTDASPATGWKLVAGAVTGSLLCCLYDFTILPRVTDFVPLMLVLAPTFLMVGSMLTWPAVAPFAIGLIIMLPTSIGLADRYSSSFESFVNTNMALVVGMAMPVMTLSVFAMVGGEARARKLLAATRRELADRCMGRGQPRTERWLATTLDRVALLYPYVARGEASGDVLDEILRSTRIGLNIDELRRLRRDGGASVDRAQVELLLQGVRDHLRGASGGTRTSDDDLHRQLDTLLAHEAPTPAPGEARQLRLPLVGLRRNLFPTATPPSLEARI